MTDEVVRLDAYVEGVLAGRPAGPRPLIDPADIDPAASRAADILARSLVRFHPSFRFEDALAARLRALGEAMHDERPEPLIGGPVLAFPGGAEIARRPRTAGWTARPRPAGGGAIASACRSPARPTWPGAAATGSRREERRAMPMKLPFRTRGQEYPPDLWTRCPSCEEMLYNKQLDKNLRVCPTLRPPLPPARRSRGWRCWWIPVPSTSGTRGWRPWMPLASSTRSRIRSAWRPPAPRPASATPPCGAWRPWRSIGSRCASWTSPSWAARWARSWGRR